MVRLVITNHKFTLRQIVSFAAVFALFGIMAVIFVSAASTPFAFEAESGTPTGGATLVSIAGQSGGGAVKFDTAQTGACIGAGNTPGGADPWGTCWPGAQNTGYPHGLTGDTRTPVTLTAYSGPSTIYSCGVVIDSKLVNGDLDIRVGNGTHSASTPCVTIKNSKVNGIIYTDAITYGPVLITDTEVNIVGGADRSNVMAYNIFASRVNIHGGHGGVQCSGYCDVRDTWIHGFYLERSWHYDSIGTNGIEEGTFVIDHNYMNCGDFYAKDASTTSDAGCSADLGFFGDFAPIRNITVNKNYFAPSVVTSQYDSSTQPGYCFSTNNPQPGKAYPTASNLVVTDNIFARGASARCGEYGAVGAWDNANGNVWTGNKWDDGTSLNL